MKSIEKKQLSYIINLLWLPAILLINSCQGGHPGLTPQKASEEPKEGTKEHEYVLFCGNPGVGKSSLCNSIIQENFFKSGVSFGEGITTEEKGKFYKPEHRTYIDTPGLSDITQIHRAAKEIKKAVQKNGKYKIVFVITLEAGKFRPEDLETINTICEAITVPFEYGIIINKVSDSVLEDINRKGGIEKAFEPYVHLLKKNKSLSFHIVKKEATMDDKKDGRLTSKERQNLTEFITKLNGTHIKPEDIQDIDTINYKKRYELLKKAIATGAVVGTGWYVWNSQVINTTGAAAAAAVVPYLNSINNAWEAFKGSLRGLGGEN